MAESRQIKYCEGVSTKTQISTSTLSGDQTFESVKSEISRETDLPLGNVNFEVNAITHDSQHKSESSCSNSLSANLPVSFSTNHKFQETSKEAYSRYTYSTDEQLHTGNVGKSSVCSDISDNFNCTSKADLLTSRSGERNIINHEISEEGENILGIKGKYESSESSIAIPGKVFVKDQPEAFIAEFDLNEDINANKVDDFIQPVVGNISSCHSVIRVLAKTGIPSGRPVIPLDFKSGLGLMGPSEMSAFRPVALSKNPDRKTRPTNEPQCCFTGIDLNVAAVEDSAAVNGIIPTGPCSVLQDSRSEVGLKRAESLCIDLNCIYDAGDDFPRLSIPVKSEDSPLLDLNLNVDTNKASSYPMKLGYQDLNPISRDNQPDLSTVQHSLQTKFPFLSHTLPHQTYPYKGRLHIGYPHEHGILPGLFNPGTVNTSFGNNHIQQVFREQSTSNVRTLSTSDGKTDEGRQFLFLADKSDDWFGTSKKRKGAEGGLECYEKRIWKQ